MANRKHAPMPTRQDKGASFGPGSREPSPSSTSGFDPSRDWQPIDTAPKDGEIFLSYWHDTPVFVAWVGDVADDVEYRRVGPFWNRRAERIVKSRESGFRVVSWSPRLGWGVNGNCAPFTPPYWMPLTAPEICDGCNGLIPFHRHPCPALAEGLRRDSAIAMEARRVETGNTDSIGEADDSAGRNGIAQTQPGTDHAD